MKDWSDSDVRELERLYNDVTMAEIGRRLGRTRTSVAQKCFRLGLSGKQRKAANKIHLCADDKLWLRLNYPHMSNEVCALKFGCDKRTLSRIANAMGLSKSREFLWECKSHNTRMMWQKRRKGNGSACDD